MQRPRRHLMLIHPAEAGDATAGDGATVREPDDADDDWALLLSAVAQRLRTEALCHEHPCADAIDLLVAGIGRTLAGARQTRLALRQAQAALLRQRGELQQLRVAARLDRHQARHDGLTTLPNRAAFRQRLDSLLQAVGGPPPVLAVLFIDLDGFKPVNDRHGHGVGDQVLRIVAARLRHVMRAGDTVGRMGGDEFALLLADAGDRTSLSSLARKLHDTVAAPMALDALQLSVRPSIGIAVCPGDGADTEVLLRRADRAMYRAKRSRSGHAFFDPQADGGDAQARGAAHDGGQVQA